MKSLDFWKCCLTFLDMFVRSNVTICYKCQCYQVLFLCVGFWVSKISPKMRYLKFREPKISSINIKCFIALFRSTGCWYIYLHEWLILMVNYVGKYTVRSHGSVGVVGSLNFWGAHEGHLSNASTAAFDWRCGYSTCWRGRVFSSSKWWVRIFFFCEKRLVTMMWANYYRNIQAYKEKSIFVLRLFLSNGNCNPSHGFLWRPVASAACVELCVLCVTPRIWYRQPSSGALGQLSGVWTTWLHRFLSLSIHKIGFFRDAIALSEKQTTASPAIEIRNQKMWACGISQQWLCRRALLSKLWWSNASRSFYLPEVPLFSVWYFTAS